MSSTKMPSTIKMLLIDLFMLAKLIVYEYSIIFERKNYYLINIDIEYHKDS